jgi:hypothetical protein
MSAPPLAIPAAAPSAWKMHPKLCVIYKGVFSRHDNLGLRAGYRREIFSAENRRQAQFDAPWHHSIGISGPFPGSVRLVNSERTK